MSASFAFDVFLSHRFRNKLVVRPLAERRFFLPPLQLKQYYPEDGSVISFRTRCRIPF